MLMLGGLTGYYRKFIHHFGIIAAPLPALVKADKLDWTPAAQEAHLTKERSCSRSCIGLFVLLSYGCD